MAIAAQIPHSAIRTALAAAILIGLLGCSKITKENYDKLSIGMDYKEVVALLGEPTKCDSVLLAKSCTWGGPPKTITVQLVSDKVALFQSEGL